MFESRSGVHGHTHEDTQVEPGSGKEPRPGREAMGSNFAFKKTVDF